MRKSRLQRLKNLEALKVKKVGQKVGLLQTDASEALEQKVSSSAGNKLLNVSERDGHCLTDTDRGVGVDPYLFESSWHSSSHRATLAAASPPSCPTQAPCPTSKCAKDTRELRGGPVRRLFMLPAQCLMCRVSTSAKMPSGVATSGDFKNGLSSFLPKNVTRVMQLGGQMVLKWYVGLLEVKRQQGHPPLKDRTRTVFQERCISRRPKMMHHSHFLCAGGTSISGNCIDKRGRWRMCWCESIHTITVINY